MRRLSGMLDECGYFLQITLKVKKMKIWFCLNNDGEIYCIGKFSDIQQADTQADKMGLSPIWLLDEETAKNWRNQLQITLRG